MKFYEVQIDILFAQLNTMFLEKTAEEIAVDPLIQSEDPQEEE